ncbi:Arrestin domain-containing protein 17 [Eumeta japonica]|uniref:Arrestin domain-containing protein 17 n=1 Tax=Eumeta variegata TaxID=151549 RepID=A0A4C1X8I6_EUMVA|nr:Arrestin domain-containing protein 17 [Eumeta japonica]
MGVHCQIYLERPPEGVYRPGYAVGGVVKYAINEDTPYRDITVSLLGKGDCDWSEGAGDSHTEEERLVKKGVYSHPFRFELPSNIPPSYKDHYCSITYCVKLAFERKGLFKFNKTFRTKIPVVSFVDVTLPREPVICGERKTFSSLLRREDDFIHVKATLKNPSLAPGDTAELHIEVKNNSSKTIRTIKTHLIQELKYIASSGEIDSNPETRRNGICSRKNDSQFYECVSNTRSFVTVVPLVIGEAGATDAKGPKKEFVLNPERLRDDLPPSYWEVMHEDKETERKSPNLRDK